MKAAAPDAAEEEEDEGPPPAEEDDEEAAAPSMAARLEAISELVEDREAEEGRPPKASGRYDITMARGGRRGAGPPLAAKGDRSTDNEDLEEERREVSGEYAEMCFGCDFEMGGFETALGWAELRRIDSSCSHRVETNSTIYTPPDC